MPASVRHRSRLLSYPQPLAAGSTLAPDAERQFEVLQRIVTAARELRARQQTGSESHL